MTRTPRSRLIAAVLLFLSVAVVTYIALSVGGSGSGKPDGPSCKAAMQRQYDYGISHPDAPAGTRPGACRGVSDADLQRYASEIMNHALDGGQ